jgi:hypothetical protein
VLNYERINIKSFIVWQQPDNLQCGGRIEEKRTQLFYGAKKLFAGKRVQGHKRSRFYPDAGVSVGTFYITNLKRKNVHGNISR